MSILEILGNPTDEQRIAAGVTTQAEFNEALRLIQRHILSLGRSVEDYLFLEVVRDVAPPQWKPINQFLMAKVNDPFADGHTGKIRYARWTLGGKTALRHEYPFTPNTRYFINRDVIDDFIYSDPWA